MGDGAEPSIDDDSSHQGPEPGLTMFLLPADGATDVATTTLGINVEWTRVLHEAESPDALARLVTLHRADGTAVEIEAASDLHQGDFSLPVGRGFVAVRPRAPR